MAISIVFKWKLELIPRVLQTRGYVNVDRFVKRGKTICLLKEKKLHRMW